MTKEIRIRKAPGMWSVRSDGAIVAESRTALELDESGHAPVIYFPRDDVAMALLDRSATTSHCPWKGDASYYSLVDAAGTVRDVAWSYEAPFESVAAIAGHIAFDSAKVTVERL